LTTGENIGVYNRNRARLLRWGPREGNRSGEDSRRPGIHS
jgi:hypothetical protein